MREGVKADLRQAMHQLMLHPRAEWLLNPRHRQQESAPSSKRVKQTRLEEHPFTL